MNELKQIIEKELDKLVNKRSLIATPKTREQLENFAGMKNMLPVQMGIQYGYKIAMENLLIEIKNLES
jgi:hypothetical protein